MTQAKLLLKLFNGDLEYMTNGIIRINADYKVDFTFIDKILTLMVGLNKNELFNALSPSNSNVIDAFQKSQEYDMKL